MCSDRKEELAVNPQKRGEIFHRLYEKRAARLRSQNRARKALDWLYNNKNSK